MTCNFPESRDARCQQACVAGCAVRHQCVIANIHRAIAAARRPLHVPGA